MKPPRVRIIQRTPVYRAIRYMLRLQEGPALAVLVSADDHSPGTCSIEELQLIRRGIA